MGKFFLQTSKQFQPFLSMCYKAVNIIKNNNKNGNKHDYECHS